MKQAKPLTRNQKEILSSQGLDWKKYSFVEEWETKIVIENKATGNRRAIDKKRERQKCSED